MEGWRKRRKFSSTAKWLCCSLTLYLLAGWLAGWLRARALSLSTERTKDQPTDRPTFGLRSHWHRRLRSAAARSATNGDRKRCRRLVGARAGGQAGGRGGGNGKHGMEKEGRKDVGIKPPRQESRKGGCSGKKLYSHGSIEWQFVVYICVCLIAS